MSFQEVDSNAIITNAELWFTEKYMYFPPAPATISEFEIWGAEIGSVKGKITTTMPTTTNTLPPTTTTLPPTRPIRHLIAVKEI